MPGTQPDGGAELGFLRLAAHPLRWELLRELARSDRQVRELTALTGRPRQRREPSPAAAPLRGAGHGRTRH